MVKKETVDEKIIYDIKSIRQIFSKNRILSVEKIHMKKFGVSLSSHIRVCTEPEEKVEPKKKFDITPYLNYVLSGNNRFYHLHFCNPENFDTKDMLDQFFRSDFSQKDFEYQKLNDRIIFHIDKKILTSDVSEIVVCDLSVLEN